MNIRCKIVFLISAIILFNGCKVNYTLSNAYLSPEVKTVSIPFISNSATMVAPVLSPTLTDALQTKFARQTKLIQVREDGDLTFEGEIINYTSTPTAVTAQEVASENKLTITIKMKFTNKLQPEYNYDRNFSAFLNYSSNRTLQDAETQLIPEIVDMLVEDMYNAALSNW